MVQRNTRLSIAFGLSLLALVGCKSEEAEQQAPNPAEEQGAAAVAEDNAQAENEVTENVAADAAEVVSHTIETSVEVRDGQSVLVTRVTPGEGFKLNMLYPRWQVEVDAEQPLAAGASLSKDEAGTMSEELVVFELPVEGEVTEAASVAGQLRFSVCNDEACLNPTEAVNWQVPTT